MGFSVPACITGHMTRGASVGSLSFGVSVQGVVVQAGSLSSRVSVQQSICPEGLCLEGSLSRGVSVQQVSLQGVSVQGASIQKGYQSSWVSVQGVSVRKSLSKGCLCPRVSLPRGVSAQGESLSRRPPYGNEWVVHIVLECILVV